MTTYRSSLWWCGVIPGWNWGGTEQAALYKYIVLKAESCVVLIVLLQQAGGLNY